MGLGPVDSKPPHYTPTRYTLDGRTSAVTPILDQALCELLGTVRSVVLLGTEKAKDRWITTGELGRHLEHEHPFFGQLPDGASEKERWTIFEKTVGAFSLDALAEAGETEPPAEIAVNITHGFRSQPILGMAAMSFVLSEWARREIAEPPRLRVFYGAHDSGTEVTPVWDLTELVIASRWNAALDALMRYGRADDLAQLAEIDGKARTKAAFDQGKRGAEQKAEGFVRRFGSAARSFADDLAMVRLLDLFTRSAPTVADVLRGDEIEALVARLPPLAGAVAMLRGWVAPLCAPNVLGREGLAATVALAERYGKLQRFAEQAAAIREGLVTHHAHLTGRGPAPEPGQSGCADARSAVEHGWSSALDGVRKKDGVTRPEPVVENAKLSSAAVDLRNDIEHGGVRNQPISARRLREGLEPLVKGFGGLVAKLDTTPLSAVGAGRTVFANLSNHPVRDWPAAQVEAARALCLGIPCDIEGGMPVVDPADGTSDVAKVAREVAERAVAQGAAGAFVAGEYTLSFAVIAALQARGVRCFAPTSLREVTEAAGDGDARERRGIFRFVRWREYPLLACS
jgi:CRISPR-associated (Cas) DxTHG family